MNIKLRWSKVKKGPLSAEEQIAREKLLGSLAEDLLSQIRRGGAKCNCHCHHKPAEAAG